MRVKHIVEVSCAALLMVALSPVMVLALMLWLVVAPIALIYNIGTMGFDDGLNDWKTYFWWS